MSHGHSEWERQQEHRATERELQAHFAGRRGALRTPKALSCAVVGRHGSFKSRLVDLSRSGALFVILDPKFASGEELEVLMLYTACAWHHFDAGLELQIESRGIQVVADVVRVREPTGDAGGPFEVGVKFRTELTEDECDRLGIECAADRSEDLDLNNDVSDAFARLFTTLTPTEFDPL